MVLLQIQEPDTPQVKTAQYRLALGIDLGTTNSLAASLNQAGDAAVLSDTKGRQLIPSVVHYAADGEACVGRKAQEFVMQDPANTITSIKRIMGKSLKEIEAWRSHYPYNFSEVEQQVPRLKIYGRQISAVEVSAQILQHLVGVAENSLGEKSAGAVITVPAYFDDAQRQATKDAARLAGINLLRLLNEPTAAAVAYGLDQQAEGVHAIYDLGGGTFDISILRLNRGVFEVLSTRGDTALGGDDFDQKIVNWITEQMGFGQECSQIFSCRLRAIAKDAREQLTTKDAVELDVQCSCGERWQGVLTREIFYQLADPLIDRTLKTCRRAMLDAGIDNEDICDVVMVGGATRMPRVRERVSQFFAREVLVSIDPDRVVAIGAALQADQLIGNRRGQQLLLLDVLPLSLGLETMGGLVEKIIPRNTSIPATRSQEFTTFKDGQSAMAIHVVQGERELVADNRSLARFELRNIPPMVAGAARIQVTFQVDADGILSVTAREAGTGVESHIEVKATYGLSENEIQAMLKASYEHARADIDLRRLREQQIEVDRVLEALKTALNKDGELLSEAERGQVDQAVAHLQKVRQESEDVKQLRDALSLLEQATQEFVLRRMNSAVAQVVTGKSIDTYDQDAAQATGHTTDQVIQEQENRKG